MPISIRRIGREGEKDHEVAWLGDEEWKLPPLIKLLQSWLNENAEHLPLGEYAADVGFCWRRNAGGGGSSLSPEFLGKMADAGITLFLSEYPIFSDDEECSAETEVDAVKRAPRRG